MSTALLIQIGQIMFPIIAIVAVGTAIGKYRRPEMDSVNEVNLNVFVPALVFHSLSQQNFEFEKYTLLGVLGLTLVLGTGILAFPISRLLRLQYRTIAPPMMFHNAGNVGLPLLALALGSEGLAAALVLFLIGNVTHFGLGSYMLNRNAHWIRSFTSPAILAAVFAFVLHMNQISPPEFIMLPIQMLGNIAVPLMLFSLGVRLSNATLDYWKSGVVIGVLTPVTGFIIALLIVSFFSLDRTQAGALLLFGALPPAVMNFLFAERFSQEPAKVSAIVLLGNVLAILTLPMALLYVLPRYG